MENIKITQEHIDKYVATTVDFWKEFHKSLSAPYSLWDNYKNSSFDDWVETCWKTDDLSAHLKLLFEYPLLKGEFLLGFYKGFVITNYRLIINDANAGKPSIPLINLQNFNADNDGKIEYLKNGQIVQLQYEEFINDSIVNSAKSRLSNEKINSEQLIFLENSKYELKEKYSDLKFPQLEMYPLNENQKNKIETENKKAKPNILYKVLAPLAALGIIISAFLTWGNTSGCGINTYDDTGGGFYGIATFIIGAFALLVNIGYLRNSQKQNLKVGIVVSIVFGILLFAYTVHFLGGMEVKAREIGITCFKFSLAQGFFVGVFATSLNFVLQIFELIRRK